MKTLKIGVAAVVVLLLAPAFLFTVSEQEYCVLMRSGIPEVLVGTPGLHVKMPFFRKAVRLERRWLSLVLASNGVKTKDETPMEAGAGVIWRISDPMLFLGEFGSRAAAETRIGAVIQDGLRKEILERSWVECVRLEPGKFDSRDTPEVEFIPDPLFDKTSFSRARMGRREIASRVLSRTRKSLDGMGVQIGEFYWAYSMYPPSFLEKVYQAMEDERREFAERLRKG